MTHKSYNNSKIKKKLNNIIAWSDIITTLHGTKHPSLTNRVASKLWMMLIVLNLLVMVGFLFVIKKRFSSDQIATQIFSDNKVNEVPFPTVSICNYNLISLRETKSVHQLLLNHNIPQSLIDDFFKDLTLLKSYRVRTSTTGNYSSVMRILKHHYYNMQTVMEELSQKCDNLLLYCEFNGLKKDCSKIFNLIKTYQGFCCGFNYAALNDEDDMDISLEKDEDFEYYYDTSSGETTSIITTTQSGRTSGLKVVFNIEPDQYPPWTRYGYGARILLSDPNDFPEVTVRYKHVSVGEALTVKVEPVIYTSDDTLRKVSPQKRGCYFHDEVFLEYTDRYSYETCNTECRMMNYLQLCGCLPYKYPADKDTRFCEISDLPCLNELIAHWSSYKLPCKPSCFLECSDKSYTVSADTVPFHYDDIITDQNTTHLSSVHVYFMRPKCYTYKQSMLIDSVYFIEQVEYLVRKYFRKINFKKCPVHESKIIAKLAASRRSGRYEKNKNDFTLSEATYGGIFSLSFGGSLLTFFEISYLILSAIITIIHDVVKKKDKLMIKIR